MSTHTHGKATWYALAVLTIGSLLVLVALVVAWAMEVIPFFQLCGFSVLALGVLHVAGNLWYAVDEDQAAARAKVTE